MTSREIRNSFIEFFKQRDHTFVPSSPVVPLEDPTLLFTNAGMNQFKDILLGKSKPPYTRAVNSQKCIRVSGKHNDLEEVGYDTYHHTFFEMLGNWSFGDYYKEEAILWAWELLTDVWKLPKNNLYATVFREDDQAAELWLKITDIGSERLLHFDEKDNFWEMGETGPCGPCSEIHIDLGPEQCDLKEEKHICTVNGDCGRFIELWNLVFIQYNRDHSGALNALPAKHVDTGAGFERLVAILQNKRSNYESDLFTPLLQRIAEITATTYDLSQNQNAFRVIADHIRMLTFSIADGAFPSNDGRGYVLRRILRRAARYGRKLNMHKPFIYKLVGTVAEIFGEVYPEIIERADYTAKVILSEEEHFNRTLDRGLEIFDKIKSELHEKNKKVIPGSDVFKLYDTYGFPFDLTKILADESGLMIESNGFEKEMEKQRIRARNAAKFKSDTIESSDWVVLMDNGATNFVGYSEDAIETHILKYSIQEDKINIVLKDTPFYAESGGQIGDRGIIALEDVELDVLDTQKYGTNIVHICRLAENFKITSEKVFAEISIDRRRQTEKNHTATHLLHKALRKVLGNHVQQAGSLVAPDRMRFDFRHHLKITGQELHTIEQIVNEKIQENIPLIISQERFKDAKKRGAMALFGEKYEDLVRTIQIDDFSLELCGGTHVKSTGQIGLFIVTYEGSIASGIRRIEALTGKAAVIYLQYNRDTIHRLGELLNSKGDEIVQKTQELVQSKKQIEKELEKLSTQMLSAGIEDILEKALDINGIHLIIQEVPDSNMAQLKELGDTIREQSRNTVALLGTKHQGKVNFVCVVTDDLIHSKNIHAGKLVQQVAQIAGGSGGGRAHMATAGGKMEHKFTEAMEAMKKLI